jgi:nitrogen fixation protein FixH
MSAANVTARNSGAIWPAAIVGLLALNVAIVGITVYFAQSDPSAAIEPNYYEKAVKWDQTAAQRDASRRLGWNLVLEFEAPASGAGTVTARLTDRSGAALEGASVEMIAFHNARAGDRRVVRTEEHPGGEYRGGLSIERSGRWHLMVTARRGTEIFTTEFDQDVVVAEPAP